VPDSLVCICSEQLSIPCWNSSAVLLSAVVSTVSQNCIADVNCVIAYATSPDFAVSLAANACTYARLLCNCVGLTVFTSSFIAGTVIVLRYRFSSGSLTVTASVML
jgi:hypothetical protein